MRYTLIATGIEVRAWADALPAFARDPCEMLLLRSPPDWSGTNADLHSQFRAKWGRENCIIWLRSRHAQFGPYTHTLSVNATWGGAKYCHVNGRALAVDDDNFLILNDARVYSTSIRSAHPVESLLICFSPELVEQQACGNTPEFLENLQPHERTISPVLRFIRAHLRDGLADHGWYEEQLVFLLARMQAHRGGLLEQIDRLAFIRPRTRREAFRRVGLATDFIHTHYEQDIDLGTLAKVAYLSKYHTQMRNLVGHAVPEARHGVVTYASPVGPYVIDATGAQLTGLGSPHARAAEGVFMSSGRGVRIRNDSATYSRFFLDEVSASIYAEAVSGGLVRGVQVRQYLQPSTNVGLNPHLLPPPQNQ